MLGTPRRRPVRSMYSFASRSCSFSPRSTGSNARFINASSGGVSVREEEKNIRGNVSEGRNKTEGRIKRGA